MDKTENNLLISKEYLNELGLNFPDSYKGLGLVLGDKIPAGSTYGSPNIGSYTPVMDNGVFFGGASMCQAPIGITLQVGMGNMFIGVYASKIISNDTATSKVVTIQSTDLSVTIVNNINSVILVIGSESSFYVLPDGNYNYTTYNTKNNGDPSKRCKAEILSVLLPAGAEIYYCNGVETISLISVNNYDDSTEVFHLSNETSGVLNDWQSRSHIAGTNPYTAPSNINVAMPSTTSTYVYNQTKNTITVTSAYNKVYYIAPNGRDNYDYGAVISVGPGCQVVSNDERTIVQSINMDGRLEEPTILLPFLYQKQGNRYDRPPNNDICNTNYNMLLASNQYGD